MLQSLTTYTALMQLPYIHCTVHIYIHAHACTINNAHMPACKRILISNYYYINFKYNGLYTIVYT